MVSQKYCATKLSTEQLVNEWLKDNTVNRVEANLLLQNNGNHFENEKECFDIYNFPKQLVIGKYDKTFIQSSNGDIYYIQFIKTKLLTHWVRYYGKTGVITYYYNIQFFIGITDVPQLKFNKSFIKEDTIINWLADGEMQLVSDKKVRRLAELMYKFDTPRITEYIKDENE